MARELTRRIELRHCWPIVATASAAHWRREGTHHGPQSMPRLFAARLVQLGPRSTDPREGVSGCRLWLYVRGGFALYFDLMIDRRDRTALLALTGGCPVPAALVPELRRLMAKPRLWDMAWLQHL